MRRFEVAPGTVVQAYRYALRPCRRQEAVLASHCGAARVAYNWAVAHVLACWRQRAAEATYGISDGELTPWRGWSLPALCREWNRVKRTDPRYGWWADNSKEAYNTGLAGAAAAFDNYTASKNGRRKGARMGLPRFKPKRGTGRACRFTTGTIRVEPDRHHVTLPRIGPIATYESTRKLARRLDAGTARILSATVSHRRGRWMVAFQVEVTRAERVPARPDATAGIDLGVKTLAVIAEATGEIRTVPNPRHYDAARTVLRRASRRVSRRSGPDRRTGQQPSRRWEKANAARNKVHHRVANLRGDALHKLTTQLAATYGTVVAEDLNVAGMQRNRRLARHIVDAGFGELRRQLTYKARWGGGRIVVADRWYPSSKTCSECGAVKAKLPLRVRTYRCEACGLVIDRDVNAAFNLAALAAACTTGTGVAGDQDAHVSNGRGADTRPRRTGRLALKRPPLHDGDRLPETAGYETSAHQSSLRS